ncbi:MAG TPA: YceI family protein [Pedobacter sp.]|uniref:YceI family protein n=1 Tax=Pedobacter sp. TaxID=1411316 RepID=UPI002BAAABF1|nr:YceI family protein [Pedobacter sp.]HMI02256.1 YceI family protein [Pedobacter sp.]
MPKSLATKWILSKECTLKVSGSTNISKFSCIIPNYPAADTLFIYKTGQSEQVKITGSMVLHVQSFDCHNPMMTKDLRKTLKQKEFPKIRISFINLSKYPDAGGEEEQIKGVVNIELAGIKKRFDINYRVIPNGTVKLTLIGSQTINFSDFNIIPPRKLGGMIKTNDILSAEFVLKVTILNE